METTAFNGSIGCPFNQKGVVVKWSCYFVEKAWTECAFEGWITGMHEMRWSCRPLEDAVEELASFIRKSDAWIDAFPPNSAACVGFYSSMLFCTELRLWHWNCLFPSNFDGWRFWCHCCSYFLNTWICVSSSSHRVAPRWICLELPQNQQRRIQNQRFWNRCWWPNSTCFECICSKKNCSGENWIAGLPLICRYSEWSSAKHKRNSDSVKGRSSSKCFDWFTKIQVMISLE